MNVVIYSRVSSQGQDNQRQVLNLKQIAEERNWTVKRIFQEKISGTVRANARPEFMSLTKYIERNGIKLVLISEVSRIGRRVIDVLNNVEMLHQKGIGLFIQQFNIITFQDDNEDPVAKMLLQMLSIGAEMENSIRRDRQLEGIQIAKIRGKYTGRKNGAIGNSSNLLEKYQDVVDLVENSSLSLRRISEISGRSVNTVQKVKKLMTL